MTTSHSDQPRTGKHALIAGAGGLLGRCITERLSWSGWQVTPFTRQQLDIADEGAVRLCLEQAQPDVVINCAATGDVDRCEREPAWAYAVNEAGPRHLARHARATGAAIVHVSTDYVFAGDKEGFYTQADEARPLSVYGQSKLAGEQAVREEAESHYILRTSWLFGVGGKNFGSRVLDYARAGAPLQGVTDQTSIATYAPDMAARIEEILARGAHGLYQVTNTGVMSWYEFALLALELAGRKDAQITPCKRADLHQLAPRPQNSAMRCLLSESLGLAPLRHWREATVEFVREYQNQASPQTGGAD